ncbi:MAG TPA: S9 family peptidase [Chloroflexota bacterium]|nr:S9 family peptidase [Chloroflexota bacterium]
MSGAPVDVGSYSYDRFLNARRCYGPSFSPDDTRVAFISDLVGVPQAWLLPTRGGWPEQITFTDDRVGFVAFSPRSDRLIVGTDVGGNENVQLWLLDGSGTMPRRLTEDPGAMHSFGGWSPDGSSIAYASNARDRASFDVIVQDVETGERQMVFQGDGNYQVACWAPDGSRLLVSRVESSSNNDLFEIDLPSRQAHHLTAHQGTARFLQPAYRRDGKALYALSDLGRDYLALVELDLATGNWRTVYEDEWDVASFSVSPDGRSVATETNLEGYSDLIVLDLASGRRQGVDIPRGVVARSFVGNWRDGLVWSSDGRRLAFSLTTARTTQNVWVADPLDGSAWPLTHATIGGLPTEALVEPEVVHYPTFDGRSIPAFLYRSREAALDGEAPAVVYIHGGPESQARPAFDPTIQHLVQEGYVVLVPNVRGSTGYGNAYAHLDDVERRLDAVADAKAGAEWLVQRGHARHDKIAAMGGSYGGFMVLASLTNHPEVWAAGVDLYGVSNFVTLLQNTHPFRRKHRSAEYGSLEQNRDLLERISPVHQLHRVTAPLFVAHGDNDIRVPIGETEQVVAALRARGIPVDFIRLPNEGHGIVRLENRLKVYPAIATFLERYVKSR